MKQQAITGCILGTAVGDALGLPYEGMSAKRTAKFFRRPAKHHLIMGKGMISDDSEHACFVAQALIASLNNPDRFEKKLAWSLRWWFLGLPAGVGLATAKSIIKLWLGFPPRYSGVFSAGNGPAMRSPLLGVVFADDIEKIKTFVQRSTRITHTDPKAYFGALTIALAAQQSTLDTETNPSKFLLLVTKTLENEPSREYEHLLQTAVDSVHRGESLNQFVELIDCKNGISGYIYHTVPCVIHCWLRHQQDFQNGLEELIAAGGDTDTTGAIFGAICGAGVGKAGIPEAWISGIIDWPRSTSYMEKLAIQLNHSCTGNQSIKPPRYFTPAILIRNLFFLCIVLLHGFRRLLPPY
ncbi:MAG: ADP-ribosylglycohydrolase family protein [Methyloprofundus sp.]|nr:ADP-ribosylglycohydrolase family protein [Methyloprofundus sp.]